MTGQQLKNSILQMAVQGKLVPQDPNDEPASVLLEKIRKEKERLIKEGKIKKEKNPSYIFRGADNLPYEKVGNNEPVCIANEIPFEIPDNWEWTRLGFVSTYAETKKKIKAQNASPHIWQLDLEDIEKGGRILEQKTVGERKAAGDKIFFETGNVLYSKLRPYLLKVLVAPVDGICTPEIVPFTLYGGILSEYVVILLKSPYVNDAINSATYGVKMPRVGTQTMVNLLLPLPPIQEQHRIISRINELLPSVEKYNQLENELNALQDSLPDQLKKSILQEAIQGKLVPQDPNDEPASVLLERIRTEKQRLIKEGKIKKDKHESIIFRRNNSYYEKLDGIERCIDDELPFEIPDGWEWSRLSLVSNMYTGNSINEREKKLKYMGQTEGLPYIGTKDVGVDHTVHYDNGVKIPFIIDKFRVAPAGSVLLCIEGGSAGRKISLTNKKVCFGNKLCCFASLGIDYRFLFYYLQCPLFLGLFKEQTSGIIGGVGLNTLKRIYLPIPPLAEQQRISRRLDSLFSGIDALRQQ